MALHQQLFKYITHLQNTNLLQKQRIEKYMQETQYVCFKIGVENWVQFLTQVRTEKIRKTNHFQALQQIQNFNDFFNGNSTKNVSKQKTKQAHQQQKKQNKFQIESPVSSQKRILHIKGGGDTQRSQPLAEPPMIDATVQQFDQCKTHKNIMQNIRPVQTAENILKYILQYEEKQQINCSQTFDTFRMGRINAEKTDHYFSTERIQEQFRKMSQNETNQNTAKRSKKSFQAQSQMADMKIKYSPMKQIQKKHKQTQVEINIPQNKSNTDEYLLAIQNTKLRKQMKQLQRRCGVK